MLYPLSRRSSAGDAGAAADERCRHMVSFEVKGGKSAAFRLRQCAGDREDLQQSRRRQEPRHASGDHDSSAPDAGRARELGISEGLLRLSVGLEDADDLIADLECGLSAAYGRGIKQRDKPRSRVRSDRRNALAPYDRSQASRSASWRCGRVIAAPVGLAARAIDDSPTRIRPGI